MERRRGATPHYRGSYEKDRLTAIVTVGFLTGVLMGVSIALAWMDITGGA